eukprot:scaffold54419_cov36-Phaeocystis_antarctica.AAC.1
MDHLFFDLPNFNADISGWDTSRVTIMRDMFAVRTSPRPVPLTPLLQSHPPLLAACTALARRLPPHGPQLWG